MRAQSNPALWKTIIQSRLQLMLMHGCQLEAVHISAELRILSKDGAHYEEIAFLQLWSRCRVRLQFGLVGRDKRHQQHAPYMVTSQWCDEQLMFLAVNTSHRAQWGPAVISKFDTWKRLTLMNLCLLRANRAAKCRWLNPPAVGLGASSLAFK